MKPTISHALFILAVGKLEHVEIPQGIRNWNFPHGNSASIVDNAL